MTTCMWLWTRLPRGRSSLLCCGCQAKTVSLPVPGAHHSKLVLDQHMAQTHVSLLASCSRSFSAAWKYQSLQSQVLPLLLEHANEPWGSCKCTFGKLQCLVQDKALRKLQVLFPIPQSHICHISCLIWPSEMASIWLFPGLQEAQSLQGLVPAAESKVKHCLAWAALL